MKFYSEFDIEQLTEAEKCLQNVYDFNDGASKTKKEMSKLKTILLKLHKLKKEMKEKEG